MIEIGTLVRSSHDGQMGIVTWVDDNPHDEPIVYQITWIDGRKGLHTTEELETIP